ncbi:hypothetical protein LJ739_00085 [Aestuariibacter halophilus]|uniref:Uncharacterized protein n=1 Tax=Fluctibacter halophilus TaxID=226011 RepID=A0ABS8G272_9ALTE|nr:hypothetical protein [Aestuariibacter halophilus]MCC2614635.1 hypothetical protein [Aestuariibacter halophilus]
MTIAHASFPGQNAGFVSFDQVRTVLWEHIEVILLLTFLIAYPFYAQREDAMVANIIDNPRQSDFFYADYFALNPDSDAKHRFIPMKVTKVTDAGVWLKVGNIAHSTAVSPREHAKFDKAITLRNYYRKDPLFLTHQAVREHFDSGIIYNARRPKTLFIDGWIVIPRSEMVDDE